MILDPAENIQQENDPCIQNRTTSQQQQQLEADQILHEKTVNDKGKRICSNLIIPSPRKTMSNIVLKKKKESLIHSLQDSKYPSIKTKKSYSNYDSIPDIVELQNEKFTSEDHENIDIFDFNQKENYHHKIDTQENNKSKISFADEINERKNINKNINRKIDALL